MSKNKTAAIETLSVPRLKPIHLKRMSSEIALEIHPSSEIDYFFYIPLGSEIDYLFYVDTSREIDYFSTKTSSEIRGYIISLPKLVAK